MKEELTITLDNDEQVMIKRAIAKKLDSSKWVLKNRKEEKIHDIDKLKNNVEIYERILAKLGYEKMPDEISDGDEEE